MRWRRQRIDPGEVEPASTALLLAVPVGLAVIVGAYFTEGTVHVVLLALSTAFFVAVLVMSRSARRR